MTKTVVTKTTKEYFYEDGVLVKEIVTIESTETSDIFTYNPITNPINPINPCPSRNFSYGPTVPCELKTIESGNNPEIW